MKKTSVLINVARGGLYFELPFTEMISNRSLQIAGVVVQEDLVEALQKGTIFAAGLDVMTPEPLPADDILTKLPNCGELKNFFVFLSLYSLLFLTLHVPFVFAFSFTQYVVVIPHLGSATHKTRDDMAILSAQNVINGIEGKPMIYSAY